MLKGSAMFPDVPGPSDQTLGHNHCKATDIAF